MSTETTKSGTMPVYGLLVLISVLAAALYFLAEGITSGVVVLADIPLAPLYAWLLVTVLYPVVITARAIYLRGRLNLVLEEPRRDPLIETHPVEDAPGKDESADYQPGLLQWG